MIQQTQPTHYSKHVVTANDSTKLFVRHYQSAEQMTADGEPRRTVVIVHGASEHGGRYDHVARNLVSRGWDVIIGDQRGHGQSGGVPMHVQNFERYLTDLDCIWRHFDLDADHTALMGHSFGSLVSIRYAQTRSDRFCALILMSPLLALKVSIHPMTITVGKVLSIVAPRFRFQTRVDPATTTRSQKVLDQRSVDPYMHRSVTAGWYFHMKAALRRAWAQAGRIESPLLLMQGELDQVVDPLVVEPWLEKVASSDTSLKLFSEHLHELHNEPDWEQTLATLADWLDERFTAGRVADDAAVSGQL